MRAIKLIAFIFAGFALANCTANPIFPPGERAQIVVVHVTKAAACRMSETGPEKTLAVSIVRYEAADPGRAVIVSKGSILVTA